MDATYVPIFGWKTKKFIHEYNLYSEFYNIKAKFYI